jgi:hypothetical protein
VAYKEGFPQHKPTY